MANGYITKEDVKKVLKPEISDEVLDELCVFVSDSLDMVLGRGDRMWYQPLEVMIRLKKGIKFYTWKHLPIIEIKEQKICANDMSRDAPYPYWISFNERRILLNTAPTVDGSFLKLNIKAGYFEEGDTPLVIKNFLVKAVAEIIKERLELQAKAKGEATGVEGGFKVGNFSVDFVNNADKTSFLYNDELKKGIGGSEDLRLIIEKYGVKDLIYLV